MFNVTQYGKILDAYKYRWNEETKTFSTNEGNLVLDFSGYYGVTFKTGSNCTFFTGSYCTFHTGSDCTFHTGDSCAFNTGSDCTFKTGYNCTFKTGKNCFGIRYDVKGVTEFPENATVKYNENTVFGHTVVKDNTCNIEGKIVEIEGKKYKMIEIKD